jgi:TrpR-related protein YerC/YecD
MSKKNLHDEAMDYLMDGILCLQTREEAYNFFTDLCTVNELEDLRQRFHVASMLRKERTYQEIVEKTGASTATISRVNRLLSDNRNGIEMAAARISRKK